MARKPSIFDYEFFRSRTISATELQRRPGALFNLIKRSPDSPVILMKDNQPVAVAISYATYCNTLASGNLSFLEDSNGEKEDKDKT